MASENLKIKVLTFNVLAQSYCKSEFLPYVLKPSYRSWKYRKGLLTEVLGNADADLICLQEVDFYPEHWHKILSSLGYQISYNRRPRKREGIVLAWKRARFVLQTAEKIIALNDLMDLTDNSSYFCRNNLGALVALAFVSPSEESVCSGLFFGTTHLFWDPAAEDIKQLQAEYLLHSIDAWISANFASQRHRMPLILAGDFNSEPDSSVYQFITTGALSSSDRPPWSRQAGNILAADAVPPQLAAFALARTAAPDCARHRLGLTSAYATTTGEPFFTNYTPTWQGTIDYIFYTPQLLKCLSTVPLPSTEEVSNEAGGLPNSRFPSDHLPLIAEFEFIQSS